MKKSVMTRILKMLDTVNEAHQLIYGSLNTRQISNTVVFLDSCREAAIAISNTIDKLEGKGTVTASLLAEYCEFINGTYARVNRGITVDPWIIYKRLDKHYTHMLSSIKLEIKVKREIVFLPYKAAMWDSLESVWHAADADPSCDAYVVPIPYYDRDQDGRLCELHYEGADFPVDVPIVHYERYSFEENQPDIIFIHNPYDEGNYITTVHPFFYSSNLKNYTKKLVYVPYFILAEANPNSPLAIEGMAHFVQTSAVRHADVVIVQSENMRLCYIEAMVKLTGEKARGYWSRKILGIGSPKFDKVVHADSKEVGIPNGWKDVIAKPDGNRKKIVLYNTTVAALLNESDKTLDKIEHVLEIFKNKKDEVALLWRPHPLMEATINSMRPRLRERYRTIVYEYRQSGWGIYDDTAEFHRAIAIADAYFGDRSSAVQLCQKAGIPVMIQNVNTLMVRN